MMADQLHEVSLSDWTTAPGSTNQWITGEPLTLDKLQGLCKTLRKSTLPCLHCQRQISTLGLRPIKLGEGVNEAGEPVEYWSQECTDEADCRNARRHLFIQDRVQPELRWPW